MKEGSLRDYTVVLHPDGNRTFMVIGVVASIVGYTAVTIKNSRRWDDALDVWGVHGMGGYVGILLLGVFASKAANPGGVNGLIFGNSTFFLKEFVAVTMVGLYAFLFTYGALWLISKVTKVRVSAEEQENGLDAGELGESAYL